VFEGTTWGSVLLVRHFLEVQGGRTIEVNLRGMEAIWRFWEYRSGLIKEVFLLVNDHSIAKQPDPKIEGG
jgi:hypothetical protein